LKLRKRSRKTAALPSDLRIAARSIGPSSVSWTIVVSFVGVCQTKIAHDLHTTESMVKFALVGPTFVYFALTLGEVAFKRAVLPRRVILAWFLVGFVGAAWMAATPHIALLYAALLAAPFPARAAAPLRAAVAQEAHGGAFSVAFNFACQAWSRPVVTAFAAVGSWLGGESTGLGAWRVGGVFLAAGLLWQWDRLRRFDLPRSPTKDERKAAPELLSLMTVPEVFWVVVVSGAIAACFQWMNSMAEPMLRDGTLTSHWAWIVLVFVGGAPLAAIKLGARMRPLVEQWAKVGVGVAIALVALSGVLAGWAGGDSIGELVAFVAAVLTLETGALVFSNAARAYLGALSIEATSLLALSTAAGAWLGALAAPFLEDWDSAAWWWRLIGALSLLVVARRTRRASPGWAVRSAHPGGVCVLGAAVQGDTTVLSVRLGAAQVIDRAFADDVVVVDTPWNPADRRTPRVASIVCVLGWFGSRTRGRKSGRIRWPFTLIPLHAVVVDPADGGAVATTRRGWVIVRWSRGWFEFNGFETVIVADRLARAHTARRLRHNK
jgi:hypothetical protein